MKNLYLWILLPCLAMVVLGCSKDSYIEPPEDEGEVEVPYVPSAPVDGRVVLAYVTYYGSGLPNPELVTHINYAFAELYFKDGKYAGFYDPPLLYDYCEIAAIYVQLGHNKISEEYIDRIITALEKHMAYEKESNSKLLYSTVLQNAVPTEQMCKKLLQYVISHQYLDQFKDKLLTLQKRYEEYIALSGGIQ
jgi:hypothetical protein